MLRSSRYFLAEDYFDVIDIFEQQDSLGGIWNYSTADGEDKVPVPQVDAHQSVERPKWLKPNPELADCQELRPVFSTPMYDDLETNIPTNLMKYGDDSSLEEYQLFPTRETVRKYLVDYASDIRQYVKFTTQVVDIRLSFVNDHDVWTVQTCDLKYKKSEEKEYDAVLVACGHYNVAAIPDIKGIRAFENANPGILAHSKFYRNPGPYANKKTVIVGNGPSGIDIASQLGAVTKQPILISQRSPSVLSYSAAYKEDVPEIAEFLPDSHGQRALRFTDGRVETDVDKVLFCTGYFYSFPFLSSLRPPLIVTGERIEHLYRHIFYKYHPTLAVIGFPSKIIPFRTFEGQVAVVARLWSNRLKLPPIHEMEQWEEQRVKERGAGRPFHVLPFPEDLDYHNEMVQWASQAVNADQGKSPLKWSEKDYWARDRNPGLKRAFASLGESRRKVRRIEELGFDFDAWKRS